jgi:hypothetical protein
MHSWGGGGEQCCVHRTYLCDDLHLLALAVLGFRDGSLETLEELIVEFLHGSKSVHVKVSI